MLDNIDNTRIMSLYSRAGIIGGLSTSVFETRMPIAKEHFACQGSGVSHIVILIIFNGERILSNVNVVV